jgi:purine-binding chemotaxis protein CheW
MQQPEITLDDRTLPIQGGSAAAMKHLRDDPAIWRILQTRARELANNWTTTATELGEDLVTFRLGEGGYSIPARFVREVQPLSGWMPLPSTPPCVVGLVNVRGRLLAALDIRPLLDIAPTAPRNGAFLLVVSASRMEVALLADHGVEVRRSDQSLAPALSTSTGRGLVWVRGIDRHLDLLLDLPLLLADPRLLDIERIIVNSTSILKRLSGETQ